MLIPDSKARELVIAVREDGMDYYVTAVHGPDLGLPPGEYYRVIVERVKLDFMPIEPLIEMAAV